MNLQQKLDRAIGHGPALPTPEQRLAAGRAALRRRRASVGAGVAAVLVAVAAPFALGLGGDARSPGVTDSPSTTPTGAIAEAWIEDGGFRFDLGGTLEFSPDAVVHERRDDVVSGAPLSVALDMTFDGERTWHLVRRKSSGNWVDIVSGPGQEADLYRNFDDFVAKATFSLEQGVSFSGPGSLILEVVDGMPNVVGAGAAIGPVVRDGARAFGFEVESGGELQFVLLRPTSDGYWRVELMESPPPGAELASWLRGLGWLPTGEEPS